ncbi:hypothetical protein HMI54_005243 [Coelomomyces lativittatus]|nr:hypothetical protein HMI54_005243 [Coelomomyces lativittatus]
MIDLESIYTYTQDPRFPTQTLKKSDHQQGCVTRLSNGTVLCLVQMDKLSLVSLLRNENYVDKTGFLEFNFQKFKETLWNSSILCQFIYPLHR